MRTLNSILSTFESRKVLAIAAVLMFLILNLFTPGTALAFQTYMPGIVRDFQRSHPDFDITPVGGYGHYAGNVSETLGADRRPVFTGSGSKVDLEWRDVNNLPIAPHLYVGLNPILLSTTPLVSADALVDTWYSDTGTFGTAPDVIIGTTMPTITMPTGLGPSVGDVVMVTGPVVLNSDIHCDNFDTVFETLILIDGDITIWSEGGFGMKHTSRIELLPGSTLKLYVGGAFSMWQGSKLNVNTMDPNLVTIYDYSTSTMDISQNSTLYATIIAPNATLSLGQGVEFYGLFLGDSIDLKQDSQLHSPGVQAFDACAIEIFDQAGLSSTTSTGGISSAATFDQWFSDVLGTNLSVPYQIPMVLGADGLYRMGTSGAFYPIDNLLFGNEGAIHNYFFTYTFQASFTYTACSNQYFNLRGSDDLWLFINDQLVIDLGGVLTGTNQIIELDRLGLTDGETYPMNFFYTNRQSTLSEFDLETNIVLSPTPITLAGTGPFD